MSDNFYVVGNGKSLENFDFNFLKDKTWVGCCLGFRDWERTGIYPDHYVCVDSVVCNHCLLYTSPSPRDGLLSRMPSSA